MQALPPAAKDFWDRPEGKTGKVFFIAILAILGFVLYKGLPFIITLLQNTLYAAFLFGILGIVIFLLLDKRFQTLIAYSYRSVMRFITKLFIELDPVAIIDNYVEDLIKNLGVMDKQVTNLRSQMGKLQEVIRDNEQQLEANIKMATKAQEAGKRDILILKSRKAGRLKDSNITLQTLFKKMEMLHRLLSKYQESATLYVEDLKDEVDVKKRERDAIRAGHSAFRSAMKVIKGDPDKVYMFEQAMQTMADDVGSRVGEIQEFIEKSKGFIESVDLQNGIYEEDGLKMLEEWANKNGSFFISDEEKPLLLAEQQPERELPLGIMNQIKSKKYDEILNIGRKEKV